MSILSKQSPAFISKILTQRLTVLYLLALSMIALIAAVGQFLVQKILHQQATYADMVLLTERQRSTSHKISRTLLQLRIENDPLQRQESLKKTQATLFSWKKLYSK